MKSNHKTIFLFIIAFLVIGGIFLGEIEFQSMTTDSGFDVDFGGGSGGGSGSGGIFDLLYLAIRYPLITLIIVIFLMIIKIIENNRKRHADGSNFSSIENSFEDKETKELLLNAYDIFYKVQKAWMNFDYEMLKTLVTDELYNSYYNQLQTLELKGQKNVMRDFYVKSSKVLSQKEENGKLITIVSLIVSFYDYLVDSEQKVIRGRDTRKVTMFYHLTFVSNIESIDKCPNCGAKLEDGNTICSYCKSHIQALSTNMKLAKKQAIKQREEQI